MRWIDRGRAAAWSGAFAPGLGASALGEAGRRARAAFAAGFEREIDERRLFLWSPVFAGAGVALYFAAAREPIAWLAPVLAALAAALAILARAKPFARRGLAAAAALALGFSSAQWRAARVAAPIIERIRVAQITGFVEEMDVRRRGARFLLRVASLDDWPQRNLPYRVRLTMRERPLVRAGDFVALKARLLPPARASLPGGYDFALDAYFARIGAVGSTLGRIEILPAPEAPDLALRAMAAVDQARNALADRIDAAIGGDAGAIAVAMVTGKRDRLSEGAKELIREAGIFHIITISGIQMTLVAGILFYLMRRLLGLSRTLALNYPIKKWAAAAALAGAIVYDIGAGSRVGTERALLMTSIVFLAVLFDRQAVTMRNLALAALVVIAVEPEAILGASFQLSFAAVAALVAVFEARRGFREAVGAPTGAGQRHGQGGVVEIALRHAGAGFGAALASTFCATCATASFMAFHFHELSPYVLIGNPLTLGIIEFFAVPCALLGAALAPLGLDGPVWVYLGLGINLVLWAARLIASAPGAGLHVPAFAPWAIAPLALGVLCVVLWRSWAWRALALPCFALGLAGAVAGPRFDVMIAPGGEAAAYRSLDGRLRLLGKRPNLFAAEQWLRADGDGAAPETAIGGRCDPQGCAGELFAGGAIALTIQREAFVDDCERARIVVTPLYAPNWCRAPWIFDRGGLRASGAVGLRLSPSGDVAAVAARALDEDRPWSPAPKTRPSLRRPAARTPATDAAEAEAPADPPFR